MRPTSRVLGAFALSCALTLSGPTSARAAEPAGPPALPHREGYPAPTDALPPQYADYWRHVQRAERIEDYEARCRAYPDLPGNRWPAAAGRARCALLRAPALSLAQVRAELDRPGGAAGLERRYAAALDAHYRDPAEREQIFLAMSVFDGSAEAGDLAQRWRQAAPDSAYASLALGKHYLGAGARARGNRFAADTDPKRLAQMQEWFALALPLLQRAQALEPRLSPACEAMAQLGMHVSEELTGQAMAQCLAVDPDSYFVVYRMMLAAQPEWGGSVVQMQEAADYAAARAGRNPMLGALVAEAQGYPVVHRHDDPAMTLERKNEIARMAPSAGILDAVADAQAAAGDAWASVATRSQYLRYRPDNGWGLQKRGISLMQAGRFADAAADLRLARERDPGQSISGLLEMAESIVRTDQAQRRCRPLVERAPAAAPAQACTAAMVAQAPDDPVAWQLRMRALAAAGSPDALKAVRSFRMHLNVLQRHPAWQAGAQEAACLEYELYDKLHGSRPPQGCPP